MQKNGTHLIPSRSIGFFSVLLQQPGGVWDTTDRTIPAGDSKTMQKNGSIQKHFEAHVHCNATVWTHGFFCAFLQSKIVFFLAPYHDYIFLKKFSNEALGYIGITITPQMTFPR